MLPDVQTLLDIQEIDKEALELNTQIARYPVIWEEVKSRMAKKKQAVAAAVEAKEKHVKARRQTEQKLRLFSDDLRRFQSQQATVKTAKEYEAMNKQVEGIKEKISLLEKSGLDLIGLDEKVDADIKAANDELKKVEESYNSEKERIRGQFNEKKSRVAALEADKKKIMQRVAPELGGIYDRINRRHPSTAIVTVRSGSCTGCHFSLLPNVLVDVHREEKPTYCPNCGRMLSHDETYTREEASAAT
ncbi:hypothetical protein IT570_05280 [Candidatus Sumerlaeota bacterium]|nr:hypothetical protein [Candidatus Sumerlaeota bacterium]